MIVNGCSYLKENYPRMSAAAIYRQLQDNDSIKNGEVSASTINQPVCQPAGSPV